MKNKINTFHLIKSQLESVILLAILACAPIAEGVAKAEGVPMAGAKAEGVPMAGAKAEGVLMEGAPKAVSFGTALGNIRLFTSDECRQLNGNYFKNGYTRWKVSADLGECLVKSEGSSASSGSYSAILGMFNDPNASAKTEGVPAVQQAGAKVNQFDSDEDSED